MGGRHLKKPPAAALEMSSRLLVNGSRQKNTSREIPACQLIATEEESLVIL